MHVPMEILAQAAGMKLTHIPFTGAGPAVLALLGGQIDAVSTGPATVLQQVKAGKLRVLAHWGHAPLASMPEVASLKDLGYNAEYAQWSGLFIPSGTPEAIAQRVLAAHELLHVVANVLALALVEVPVEVPDGREVPDDRLHLLLGGTRIIAEGQHRGAG